jgi:hypothetical protein
MDDVLVVTVLNGTKNDEDIGVLDIVGWVVWVLSSLFFISYRSYSD